MNAAANITSTSLSPSSRNSTIATRPCWQPCSSNMRFWLDRGVDGFRVDVIWLMIKDDQFRDEPIDPHWDGVTPHASLRHIYTGNLPEVHAIIRRDARAH